MSVHKKVWIVCGNWEHKTCSSVIDNVSNIIYFTWGVCNDNKTMELKVESINSGNKTLLCTDKFCYMLNMVMQAERVKKE